MADDTPNNDEKETATVEPARDRSAADIAPSPEGPSRAKRMLEVALIVLVVLGLDLWTKAWAWANLREGATVTVVEDWIYFEFGFNTGSAFSLLRDATYAR